MNKNLITLAVFAIMSSCVYAQQITEQQAKERALQFLTDGGKAKSRSATGKLLKKTRVEVSNLYAYNLDGGGFVIVSGDERTIPVLGYSDKGQIDWQHMPENMRAWLNSYAETISALGDASLSRGVQTRGVRQAVTPLLSTKWGQYDPYWIYCPEFEKGRALTGCVATAMAQVMNYHRWPKAACEKIPAYKYPYNDDTLSLDELPQRTFNWDLMKTDMTEVAHLMRYCGQSVLMAYSEGTSTTDGAFIADALRLYFDYDQGLYYANRTMYGVEEWEQLIYDELAAGRPVAYCGQAGTGGGHCFVCDGYDDNGLFHFNWGWDGASDGYFSLSVLNPYNTSGAGASSSKMGYNLFQEAIIGVQPPTGQTTPTGFSPKLVLFDNIGLDNNTVKVECHYDNMVNPKVTFELAMGTIDANGTLTPMVKADKTYEIESREYNINVDINLANGTLSEGSYQLVPMARCLTTNEDWHMITVPEKKVLVEVSATKSVTCKLAYLPDIEIERAYISIGYGIATELNEVKLVVKNKGHEYSGALCLRTLFLDNQTAEEAMKNLPSLADLGQGEKAGGFLRAKSTEEIPFFMKGDQKGKYLLLLYESNSDVLLGYTTVALDKDYEYEFIDLEVTGYKIEYIAEDMLKYSVTIINIDKEDNWPKYKNAGEILITNMEPINDTGGGKYSHVTAIPMGEERTFSGYFDLFVSSDVKFWIEEKLGNGESKKLLDIVIKAGETLTYPEPTGIKTARASSNQSSLIYDLNGRLLDKRPAKGLYIENGKVKK